jgi:predicted MFS family arabinose efflux permease
MSDSASTTSAALDLLPETVERSEASWPAIVSLTLGVFGLVTAEFLPASLLTPMARDVGVSVGIAGQAVTATAVVGAIAGLATAIVTRGLDRRVVVWGLTGLLILSSLLAAAATNLAVLLLARVLLGIGLGGFWSMVAATAMRLVPASALPKAMSLIFTGVSVATVSAAPIGAYLGDLWGWRIVFLLSAALGVVALGAQLFAIPRLPPLGSPDMRTLVGLLRRPSIRVVLLAILVCISGHFAGFTYIRPFLEQVPMFSVEALSVVLLAYGVGGFFGNLAGGAIVASSAKAAVIAGSAGIGLMAITLLLFGGAPAVAAVAVGLWGFAFGAIPVGVQTWMVRIAPNDAQSSGGLLVAAFQVAIASGAILGGLLVDSFGALGAIGYAATATLLGAIGVLAFRASSPEQIEPGAAIPSAL